MTSPGTGFILSQKIYPSSLEDVHWALLGIEVATHDYAYAVRHARTLTERFGQVVGPNDATGTSQDELGFAAFFASPEYAAFVAEGADRAEDE